MMRSQHYQTQEIIERELDHSERYLWSGRPKQGIFLRGSDVIMIPFSLLWGGFAIFWEYMALGVTPQAQNAPAGIAIVFPLFGLPFVLVGLYMIFGRFIVDARLRSKTYYGVSDKRVIIVSGLFKQTVKSLDIKSLDNISLVEKANGAGSIIFGQAAPAGAGYGMGGFPGRSQYTTPQFELIENARNVYSEIQSAREKD